MRVAQAVRKLNTGWMDLPLRMPRPMPSFGAVVLRPFLETDVPMLIDLSSDPYVPLTGTLPPNADRAGALAYIERQHDRLETGTGYSFCVARSATAEAVGQAGLWLRELAQGRATAGYAIAPASRGHGLAAQALRALTEFAWTIPELHRVELYVEPWNQASAHTAEAAGYRREGVLRSHQEIGDQRVDMIVFARLRTDQ